VLDLERSMVNFRVPLWAKDLPTAMRMTWDLHQSIAQRFEHEGIALGRPTQVNYESQQTAPQVRGARSKDPAWNAQLATGGLYSKGEP
jgi:small-conductance mechanosensitive channel